MDIYPAIDLRGGRVVRLSEGDFDRENVYADNPLDVAKGFESAGAKFLHVVDLDGAREGEAVSFAVIEEIAQNTNLFVEVGGGIRAMDRLERYIEAGISRCIIGTAAVRNPSFLKTALQKYGDAVAVGVDAKDGHVAVSGWQDLTELKGYDFCLWLRELGVKTIIYTDIARDGMLKGPNFSLYSELSGISGINIIASGGVTSLEDVKTLAQTGVKGAIIGKALYTGMINLHEALEIACP